MHTEAKTFLESIKKIYPWLFQRKRVIDIGAGDINGNNRYLFENCEYIGVDVVPASNVDLVSMAKDIPESIGKFDVVISSECFEHDMQVAASLKRIMGLLKPGGFLLFTCASEGRPEHGTKRTTSFVSYSTQLATDIWYPNYYQNIIMDDVMEILSPHYYFNKVYMEYNKAAGDLYFYGFRNDNTVSLQPENKLSTVMDRHKTDKNQSFHNYPRQYEDVLKKYRFDNLRLLEIGVLNGESLLAWRDYFRNATHVVGIDINPACKKIMNKDNGIYVHIGDSTDAKIIEELHMLYGPFDIIIDDGSHKNTDVRKTFELLFPLMSDKGIYIVEDTITYKAKPFQDASEPNQLEYFASLVRHLNQWRFDGEGSCKDHCIDPFKIKKKTADPLEYGIDSIHFGCSFIAIKKLVRTHWKA